jgi:PAS domain S-box-containing protein
MTDRRTLTEHKRVETAVRVIAEGVSAATGEAFFRSLMQYLAKTLAADYAFVGEMSPEHDNMIRTVAVSADGQIAPNFAYDLRDTPCQNVTSGTLCVYPDRIQSRFPHDRSLAKMGIEGYVGTPLCDSQERVIGLMVMLSRRPLEHPELCVSTLRIFATRAAAELERKQAEEAVRESEERFRQLTENIHEVFWMTTPDLSEILYISPAYETVWGRTRESLYQDVSSFIDAIHPEDRPRVIEVLAREGERGFAMEYRVVRPDSSMRWIWDRGFPVKDQAGRVYRLAGIAEDITERKQAEEQLRATSAQLRALMASLQSAREQEGIRIAREIHDELGSALTSLRWDLEAIEKTLSEVEDQPLMPALRDKIGTMVGLIDTTIHVVRRISSELRPHILDDLGLAAAIEWQTQQFQARTGIMCQYDGSGESLDLDQAQSTAIFRIFQEALTNVLRHAQATRVDVTLEEEEAELVLKIRDNGRGITEGEQGGPLALGLLGMRERAHLIGGRVDLTGIRGQGTTVTLRVPPCSAQGVQNSGVRAIPGSHHLHSPGMRREQNNDENPCSG